jgi:L-ascorbate metabolism protein UlaG (beta-lactamase superfamily)
MHLTWYDNNSWLIEISGQRILLDPWIVGTLVFGNLPWLFQGHHTEPRSLPDRIDLILLSQGLEDHAHPPTLQQLDRTIPVVASPNAAKVVRELGYTTVTELAHGESHTLGDRVQIQATPGAPIGPFLVENGYLLTELETKLKLYYEPHGFHSPTLKAAAPVDVVITPLISLELPLMGALIQGDRSAPQLVEWLQPQVMLPTAAGGDVQFEGVLTKVIKQVGSIEDFKAQIAEKQLPTRVLSPRPGDRFEPLAANASINLPG